MLGVPTQAGGIPTLLDVLMLDDMLAVRDDGGARREDDVVLAMEALGCVAKCGRPFKEEICAAGGVAAIVQVRVPLRHDGLVSCWCCSLRGRHADTALMGPAVPLSACAVHSCAIHTARKRNGSQPAAAAG